MRSQKVRYEVKAIGWELIALSTAFTVIFLAVAVLVFIIFRAADQISSQDVGVNTALYTETHLYVVLVEAVLWIVIARAAIRFKAYTRAIRSGQDGKALNYIANAILLSLVYAILFGMASTSKTLFLGTPYLSLATTISNLLPLAVFVVVSVLLFIGSYKLRQLAPASTVQKLRSEQTALVSIALFTVVFILYAQYFYNVSPALLDDDGLPHFTLSSGTLIAVYLLPFALVWLLGLVSSLNLAQYANHVAGKVYRPMFRSLYCGILLAYIGSYLVQIFYVSNVPSNNFGIGLLSLLSLLVMLTVGYGLMYRGVNKLYSIER